jgi:membrane fusion protein (multidrug efflux system)
LIRLLVIGLVAFLVLTFAINWNRWVGASRFQSTDDAYLQADLAPIGAKVSGRVRNVPVRDFQRVSAGDLLVEIEDDDYSAQVAQAAANVNASKAALTNLKAQREVQNAVILQAEATIAATEADVTRDTLEATRQQNLLKGGVAGTPQAVEQAVAAKKRSEATLTSNHAQLEQQQAQLSVLNAQEAQTLAELASREAALDLARISLNDTRIVAPRDGEVGRRQVNPGQFVSVGTTVITLVPLPDVFVIANFKETQLTNMHIGQPATVTVDTFPSTTLHGHVSAYAPATGSQFALLPPDNATGNFTKVVQRIPVKILLDQPNPLTDRLRPGMSVIATVDTRATTTDAESAPETAEQK